MPFWSQGKLQLVILLLPLAASFSALLQSLSPSLQLSGNSRDVFKESSGTLSPAAAPFLFFVFPAACFLKRVAYSNWVLKSHEGVPQGLIKSPHNDSFFTQVVGTVTQQAPQDSSQTQNWISVYFWHQKIVQFNFFSRKPSQSIYRLSPLPRSWCLPVFLWQMSKEPWFSKHAYCRSPVMIF